MILAIDPGPKESAFVILDDDGKIWDFRICDNELLISYLKTMKKTDGTFVIEMIASFGMAVGQSVFETCFWIGRFIQACPMDHNFVYRKEVCLHLCGSARAKDTNIRQALIDRFPATGGGKVPQIGVKKNKGPLFGITSHLWAALAVAVTYAETKQ